MSLWEFLAALTAFAQGFAYARVETRVVNDMRLRMFHHIGAAHPAGLALS